MIIKEGNLIQCDSPGCDVSLKNIQAIMIKAGGWLFQTFGRAYCPLHRPTFYEKTRRN